MNNPITHGNNMNPMKKVTDPHSIRDNEIPNINDANPAGVICATGALRLAGADDEETSVGN